MTRLKTIETVTTYEGEVASSPPAQPGSGRVYPYVVAWPSAGHTPEEQERALTGHDGALDWPVQLTVAAGEVEWCLDAADLVRARLENHELLPGITLQEDPSGPPIQPDRDAHPVRFYVPLLFRALTP